MWKKPKLVFLHLNWLKRRIWQFQALVRMWNNGNSTRSRNWHTHFENSQESHSRHGGTTPRDSVIPPLEMCLCERNMCPRMFIAAALLTVSKNLKHLKCISTEEWIQKPWYVYTTYILYSYKTEQITVTDNSLINLKFKSRQNIIIQGCFLVVI